MVNVSLGGIPGEYPAPQAIWDSLNEPWCPLMPSQDIPVGAVVLVHEVEPFRFLAYLWAGLLADAAIILANPSWRQQEWQQVAQQLQPDIILGQMPPVDFKISASASEGASPARPAPGQILIATGGTSGQIKFVVHTWQTLTAAAQGFLTHFDQRPVNSYCVLPLYHVSGLMQAMRVWLSQGQLITQPFRQLEAGQPLVQPNSSWFISLVPTQLQRLMRAGEHRPWLAQFRAILLGGAPAWPDLLVQAQGLPIALTYGMSETAAQVATLLPEEFDQGLRSNGAPLPHVQLEIHAPASSQGQPPGTVGRIALKSPSLALGYWPHRPLAQGWFYPDDLGYVDARGHVHVVGRRSHKIITGGENVFPAEVEAALLATGRVQDVCVVGLGDRHWGQIVAALYVTSDKSDKEVTPLQLKQALVPLLSGYKHPKRWRAVPRILRNAQGKVNRPWVLARLTQATQTVQDLGAAADD